MERSAALVGMVAVAVSLVAPPQDEEERGVVEMLDELIERTQSIESYRVVYESVEESPATVTILYEWPGKARAVFDIEENPGEVIVADGVVVGMLGGRNVVMDYRLVSAASRRIDESVREAFSVSILSTAGVPGAQVTLLSLGGRQQFNLGWSTNQRSPLSWLETMKRDTTSLELDGDSLLCHLDDEQRVWVDLESGFPSRGELLSAKGGLKTIELVELEVDVEIPEGSFDLSDIDTEAAPDEDVKKMMSTLVARNRDLLYNKLLAHFDTAPDAWDEDTVRSVFATYHEVLIDFHLADWIASLRKSTEAFGEKVAESSSALTPDEVDGAIERSRLKFEGVITPVMERYLETPDPRLPAETPTEYLEDMLQLDLEVGEAAFLRLVTDPLLEHFDQVAEENRLN